MIFAREAHSFLCTRTRSHRAHRKTRPVPNRIKRRSRMIPTPRPRTLKHRTARLKPKPLDVLRPLDPPKLPHRRKQRDKNRQIPSAPDKPTASLPLHRNPLPNRTPPETPM